MMPSTSISIAAVLPQSSIGTEEIAVGLADYVVGSDSYARVQVFSLQLEDVMGLDVTRFEGVLTWMPSSFHLAALRMSKTTVLWSLFSSYKQRHAELLLQRIFSLKEKVGAAKIVVVSDTSTWGQERIVSCLTGTASCGHYVLEGDVRQHSRILARHGGDGRLSDWLKSCAGSLVVCSDSNVAQRVFCAAENTGLVMPDDLALVSLHDDATAAMNGISAFQVPFSRIGYHAICSLTHRLVGQTSVPRLSFPWRLVERRSTLDSKTMGPLAVRAYQLIEREAGQGLTFDEVVRNLGVAPRTLSRQFSSAFGITPSRHIRNVKLSLANTLLTETAEKVGEIAVRCGFSDASKFCVFYKRETGRTPSEYRESKLRC